MNFCDACETCAHCLERGCIPITKEPEPRLLQDEAQTYGSKGLCLWFSSKLDARRRAREAAAAIAAARTPPFPLIDPSLLETKEPK